MVHIGVLFLVRNGKVMWGMMGDDRTAEWREGEKI